ncbi:uncharacterized protein EV420DRAFT_298556 [Desarmillaria tabescens]|uniref:Uncharacterized protein n=1 Tax=Armillaria tabescens TaxID=1929756 RepID=A0AA39MIZ6_ARMTA|nr:uncharacterized protein EV420DRAFT_298556 [Desarmillaria tabescens]KAK0435573.1 hypothetical protein EV420DRAFT_298556 [Desarmillaria tabescens]
MPLLLRLLDSLAMFSTTGGWSSRPGLEGAVNRSTYLGWFDVLDTGKIFAVLQPQALGTKDRRLGSTISRDDEQDPRGVMVDMEMNIWLPEEWIEVD